MGIIMANIPYGDQSQCPKVITYGALSVAAVAGGAAIFGFAPVIIATGSTIALAVMTRTCKNIMAARKNEREQRDREIAEITIKIERLKRKTAAPATAAARATDDEEEALNLDRALAMSLEETAITPEVRVHTGAFHAGDARLARKLAEKKAAAAQATDDQEEALNLDLALAMSLEEPPTTPEDRVHTGAFHAGDAGSARKLVGKEGAPAAADDIEERGVEFSIYTDAIRKAKELSHQTFLAEEAARDEIDELHTEMSVRRSLIDTRVPRGAAEAPFFEPKANHGGGGGEKPATEAATAAAAGPSVDRDQALIEDGKTILTGIHTLVTNEIDKPYTRSEKTLFAYISEVLKTLRINPNNFNLLQANLGVVRAATKIISDQRVSISDLKVKAKIAQQAAKAAEESMTRLTEDLRKLRNTFKDANASEISLFNELIKIEMELLHALIKAINDNINAAVDAI
jgi:hypothetical protein